MPLWFWSHERRRSDDALRSRGNPGRGQGAASGELGRLEGVGEAGRGGLKKEAPEDGRQIRRPTTPLWKLEAWCLIDRELPHSII
jgi:hypothetical protein